MDRYVGDMSGKSESIRPPGTTLDAVDRDRLEYIADLLLELRTIASEAKCDTLAGLLSLSHAEALRRANGAGN